MTQRTRDYGRFTQEQWWAMCNCNMSNPVPLAEADLSKPFVYDRSLGVFYVGAGYHPSAMSLLLAWQHGLNNGIDVAQKLALGYSYDTAEHYLETTDGACYRSSVSKAVTAWSPDKLNDEEKRIFGNIRYIG